MEFKGTPGPWTADGHGVYSNDATGSIVAACGEFRFTTRTQDEAEANAQAIAAVPEMIAALQECREILSDMARPADVSLAPVAIASAWARCVEAEAKARAALSRALTPEGE